MIKTISKAHLTYKIPVRCAFSRLFLFNFSIFLYLFHSYCYKIILSIYCIFSSLFHRFPQYHVITFYHILLKFFSKSSISWLLLRFFLCHGLLFPLLISTVLYFSSAHHSTFLGYIFYRFLNHILHHNSIYIYLHTLIS